MTIVATLVFIRKDNQLLLGMKKRGLGEGRWNGFGGKVLENETIEAAAMREVEEECGINVTKLEQRGIINFSWPNKKSDPLEGHIFEALEYSGNPIETEEMKPQWFDLDKIPYEEMWADDILWLPHFLANKKFKAEFSFDDSDKIIAHSIDFEQ